jgi:glycerophosphoryl diester phosphodiesterase
MNRLIALSFIFIMLTAQTAFAFSSPQDNLYLTAYTLTKDKVIADIRLRQGELKSVRIEGAPAFAVEKNMRLVVKQNKLDAGRKWFDVTLHAETSAGPIQKTFRIIRDEFIRNKVIAHRGAWKNTGVTENSIGALKHAAQLKCEGSEFDVHMSADSIPFVNHDPLIQGVSIARTNATELLAIKLADGETLPTLENYLKAGMDQFTTKLILEIKPSELGQASSIALTRKILMMVENMRAQAWVEYISFDYEVCKEVMRLAPYAKVAYLKSDKAPAELATDHFFGLDYHFSVFTKNPGWIGEAKAKKLTVNVWTVNDKETMEDLLTKQVDFITTNEPELLLSLVK